jgi:peptidoglycan hydrolase-like protein with peptidoglycan-binding domain
MANVSPTGSGTTSHNTVVVRTVRLVLQTYPGTAGTDAERAISGVKYKVTIGKTTTLGTTGADGVIELRIPAGMKATVEALGTSYDVTPVAALEDVAKIRGWQRRLQHLGYELGEVDGMVGRKTGTATLQFQADNNLDTDGKVATAPSAATPTRNQIRTAMGE